MKADFGDSDRFRCPVRAVALHEIRLPPGTAGPAAHRRHRVHQRQQLRDVIAAGGRQLRRKRNPLAVSENVMFRPRLTAIGWLPHLTGTAPTRDR